MSRFSIQIHRKAQGYVQGLPDAARLRIRRALDLLRDEPFPRGAVKVIEDPVGGPSYTGLDRQQVHQSSVHVGIVIFYIFG
ncbi:MAG: hypothetical protein KKA90_02570 [Nanoarchaeota archaeon]|nr:hypothetical protein [Nanoarchaeota archaeon]